MSTVLELLSPVMVVCALVATATWMLDRVQRRYPLREDALVEAIDALLPQTQCGQCGHPGCRPYAMAVAAGAPIDLCPPGGDATVRDLAALLGESAPDAADAPPPSTYVDPVAWIDETECIGCTLCIEACPVDAIIGAQGHMHTILVDVCTGCDLCIEPCPVDCIELRERAPWEAIS